MDKVLYTITAIDPTDELGDRTPHLCSSLADAQRMVEANDLDLFEGTYEFVVIEEVMVDEPYGGVEARRAQWWYQWLDGGYVPIPVPEQWEHVQGFGIG